MGRRKKMNLPNITIGECLPEELITDILLRLPVKSLGKFQLVCKKWQSLISNPSFHKSHFQFSISKPPTSSTLLAIGDGKALFSLNVKQTNNGVTSSVIKGSKIPLVDCQSCEPIGSCNGLICFRIPNSHTIHVLNPVTKKQRLVPCPFVRFGCYIYASGFCFVPSIKDYKVVIVIANYGTGVNIKNQAFVLSFKNDIEWRKLDNNSFDEAFSQKFPSGQVVSFNENLYWIVVAEEDAVDRIFLVKFDMVEEVFERVSNLKQINDDYNNQRQAIRHLEASIGVVKQDTLCVCQLYTSTETATQFGIDMWILEQYGKWDSWKRLFKVRLDTHCMDLPMHASNLLWLRSDRNGLWQRHDLIGFMSNCNVLMRILVSCKKQNGRGTERRGFLLVLVDPTQDPPTYHFSVGSQNSIDAASYVPSLISPCNVLRQVHAIFDNTK